MGWWMSGGNTEEKEAGVIRWVRVVGRWVEGCSDDCGLDLRLTSRQGGEVVFFPGADADDLHVC